MKKVLTIKMLLLAAATLAITLGPDPADASARRAIRLRVNDAVAEPGGLVAVVVRTYAPRPISQGQISVRTKRKGRTRRVAQDAAEAAVRMPLTLENYKVFSRRDDAKVSVRVETQGNSQNVILQFSSKSGTINRADGPLAVLYFRLAPNVKPRQEFELTINADQTFVVNPNGKPIRFEPKPGVLRVRGPGAHHRLEIEGDTARITREVDGGLQTINVKMPAVVTVDLRLNEPRYASLPNIMKAKKKPLDEKTAADYGVDVTPRLTVVKTTEPETRKAGVKVGSVDELIAKLKDEAGVI